jgi:hypothetical protein
MVGVFGRNLVALLAVHEPAVSRARYEGGDDDAAIELGRLSQRDEARERPQ